MNLYSKRFVEISALTDELEASKRPLQGHYGVEEDIEYDDFTRWLVRVEALINDACGAESKHLKHFVAAQKNMYSNTLERFQSHKAIFLAARDDFNGGYLSSIRSVVQAEVFSNELDQARELLDKKYKNPAAVIAGVVLETSLRELCDRNGLAHGKVDKMNADLAKAGAYNLLMQKRITALAQIRNDAAHGNYEEFDNADVEVMISDVERFVADLLT
jgi:hypothetical protein